MFGQKYIHTDWTVWFQWILLTSLGRLVAVTGLNLLWPPNLDALLSNTAFYLVWGLALFAIGAVVATSQWLILRRYFSGAARWIVTSGAGMMIGGILPFPLKLRDWYVSTSGFQLDEIAYGVVFGFLMGVAQWLIMRTWVRSAGWWVLGSTIGWGLGMAGGELLSLTLDWNSTYIKLVYELITEGIPVAVTGFVLVMLLRNPLISEAAMDKSAA